ncbi:hypothetical protein [Maribacter sp. 4G9]|uniref:DUF7079 family protein n=1 Tax=Maribacter sp. 4G9 TaxID=1889777 RepID=UPI000C154C70|nr:hypothetical protein [Maribacter sp. 4G9]PIB38405.1 hypothetical protein BFP75_15980 [Maribacter sp. 4G9]
MKFDKMYDTLDIAKRKPIWVALSLFYLDTQLQKSDYLDIAFYAVLSPYTLMEIKEINRNEVFPVLYPNLTSIASEWDYFKEADLIKNIKKSLQKRNIIKKIELTITYYLYRGLLKYHWDNLDLAYRELLNNGHDDILKSLEQLKKRNTPFDFGDQLN